MLYFREKQLMARVWHQYYLLFFTSLALLILVGLQVRWISMSKQLVEKQFDFQVNSALRTAAAQINQQVAPEAKIDFLSTDDQAECGTSIMQTKLSRSALRKILDEIFAQYSVPLNYTYEIVPIEATNPLFFSESEPQYSCVVGPEATERLQIRFLGKKQYVRQSLAWMITLTLGSIGLSIVLFLLIVRQLVRQKRLNQWNVDFFNNMAHEFRTPLTNMKLALGMLLRKSNLTTENPYVRILQQENSQLFQQVERVLDISKLEQEQLLLRKAAFSLTNLCKDIVEKASMAMEARDGHLEIQLPEEECWIDGDALHIGNAIRNVLDNALKYCEQEPHIALHLEQKEQYIELRIQDNGVGIASRHQQAVFQRFFRIRAGNPAEVKGFGLGLAYAKKVIEQHAGQLLLHSKPGMGSTLRFLFPVIHQTDV